MDNKTYLETPIGNEKELNSYFKASEKLVIFDVGSCDGLDSIRYSRMFPNSSVYLFEPLPKNMEEVHQNIKDFNAKNISCFPIALSNVNGILPFHVSSGLPEDAEIENWNYGNKSGSLLPPGKDMKEAHPWLKFDTITEVKCQTLDTFAKEHNIVSIDFLHMDVQGAELQVLEGGEKTIANVKVIWLEVETVELYKDQPLKIDIETFLSNKGFTKIKDTAEYKSGDQLWANLKFFPKKRLTRFIWKQWDSLKNGEKKSLKTLPNPSDFKKISYSQAGEDLIVNYIFQVKGISAIRYLDIGAHHPYKINNTQLFYENGGSGVNVEPNSILCSLFKELRPRDINLNIGVALGSENEVMEYYIMDHEALNTFSKSEMEEMVKKGRVHKRTDKVATYTINYLLETYFKEEQPHVVFIDVEGLDLQIIQSMDLETYSIPVICVETITYATDGSGTKISEIGNYLEAKGYMNYADTNINTIFVKKDFWLST